jgi:methylamine utilization protein MauE
MDSERALDGIRKGTDVTYLALGARCLIGIVFAVSAFTKLRSRPAFEMFSAWITTLPGLSALPGRERSAIAVGIASAEAITVLLVALPWTSAAGLAVAAAVLAVFAAGVTIIARSQVNAIPCQCFGPSSTPLGLPHAVRNGLLGAVAAIGAAGVGPAATQLPGKALSLGLGAACALPAIFLDDLIAVFAGGRTALPPPQPGPQTGKRKART